MTDERSSDVMDRYRRLLEVGHDATADTIFNAYKELRLIWDPSRLEPGTPVRLKAEAKVQELETAFNALIFGAQSHGTVGGGPVVSSSEVGRSSAESSERPAQSGRDTRQHNPAGVFSLIFGLAGAFIYQIIIIPVLAAVIGVVALTNHDRSVHRSRWMAIVGLVLGIVYSLLSLSEQYAY